MRMLTAFNTHDVEKWRALLNTITKLRDPRKRRSIFLTAESLRYVELVSRGFVL
jgi:hypothetical protein